MLLITEQIHTGKWGSDTSITTPDTGDRVMKVLVPLIIVMVIAVAGIVYVAVSSKKKKRR